MMKWIHTFLIPALSSSDKSYSDRMPHPSLIAAQFHKTDAVLISLRAHDIIPSMIPRGCTGLIQPLDVSINGPFKNMLRDALDIEMDQLGQAALDYFDIGTDNVTRDRRILMTKAVSNAWETVSDSIAWIIVIVILTLNDSSLERNPILSQVAFVD